MVAIKEKFRIKRNKKKLKGSFILLLKVFIPPSASSSTVENGQEQRIRSRERIHAVNNYGREQDNGWKTSSNCLLPKTTPYLSMPAVQLSSSPRLWFSGQNVFARFIPCFRRSSTPAPNLRSVFNFISAFVVENIVHLLLQWNIAQKFPNATMEIFVKKKKGNVRGIDSRRNWNSISSSTCISMVWNYWKKMCQIKQFYVNNFSIDK